MNVCLQARIHTCTHMSSVHTGHLALSERVSKTLTPHTPQQTFAPSSRPPAREKGSPGRSGRPQVVSRRSASEAESVRLTEGSTRRGAGHTIRQPGQRTWAPTGQVGDNLNIEVKNNSKRPWPTEKREKPQDLSGAGSSSCQPLPPPLPPSALHPAIRNYLQ